MRTYAIVNRKGGVGKTTTALNLAYILAADYGKRVLLIDADSQGNASSIVTDPDAGGLAAVLQGREPYYENLIDHTGVHRLDLLPAGEELGDLDLSCMTENLEPDFYALFRFLEAVAEDGVYNAAVIDCPPYFSLSCLNAICAADRIIIPTGADAFSATGVNGLTRQIESIRRACPAATIAGCLVTQWRRSDVVADAVGYLREESPCHVFHTVIRRTDKVLESTWAGQSAAQWSPRSAAAQDYRTWVGELLEKEGLKWALI